MMNIIRAWKDEEYRLSLSDEERSLLPDNPAGPMELSDDELDLIIGGGGDSNDSNDSKDSKHGNSQNGLINVTCGHTCIDLL
jgi:mersacidin/lichenicidin family type 2 lantibiotic